MPSSRRRARRIISGRYGRRGGPEGKWRGGMIDWVVRTAERLAGLAESGKYGGRGGYEGNRSVARRDADLLGNSEGIVSVAGVYIAML